MWWWCWSCCYGENTAMWCSDDTVCCHFTSFHCCFSVSYTNFSYLLLARLYFFSLLLFRFLSQCYFVAIFTLSHAAAAFGGVCDGSCSDDIICIFNLGLGRYTVALLFPHWFLRVFFFHSSSSLFSFYFFALALRHQIQPHKLYLNLLALLFIAIVKCTTSKFSLCSIRSIW